MKQYFQCRLRQRGTDTYTTGWIEERGAKVDAWIELLPSHVYWKVVEVYDHGLPGDMLKDHQQMHRNSLPSVEGMGR